MSTPRQKNDVPIIDRELWTRDECAQMFNVGADVISHMLHDGHFPQPLRLGPRGGSLRWRAAEVRAHLTAGCPHVESWQWKPHRLATLDELINAREAELSTLERKIARARLDPERLQQEQE